MLSFPGTLSPRPALAALAAVACPLAAQPYLVSLHPTHLDHRLEVVSLSSAGTTRKVLQADERIHLNPASRHYINLVDSQERRQTQLRSLTLALHDASGQQASVFTVTEDATGTIGVLSLFGEDAVRRFQHEIGQSRGVIVFFSEPPALQRLGPAGPAPLPPPGRAAMAASATARSAAPSPVPRFSPSSSPTLELAERPGTPQSLTPRGSRGSGADTPEPRPVRACRSISASEHRAKRQSPLPPAARSASPARLASKRKADADASPVPARSQRSRPAQFRSSPSISEGDAVAILAGMAGEASADSGADAEPVPAAAPAQAEAPAAMTARVDQAERMPFSLRITNLNPFLPLEVASISSRGETAKIALPAFPILSRTSYALGYTAPDPELMSERVAFLEVIAGGSATRIAGAWVELGPSGLRIKGDQAWQGFLGMCKHHHVHFLCTTYLSPEVVPDPGPASAMPPAAPMPGPAEG